MARSDAGKQRRDCGNAVERRRKGMVEPQRIHSGKVGKCSGKVAAGSAIRNGGPKDDWFARSPGVAHTFFALPSASTYRLPIVSLSIPYRLDRWTIGNG
ncbi:hypothetical protein [Sphingobacterium detergens]|uniref:hypothetical protein n=1 Tax=Sphingobacterium detergens TaxID=1145106 RepID=UPI0011C43EAC|nr:hypothetical protein [Sphingobacterium detergens]